MALNLRQIEVFRAVMLTGTVSGAAKLLYVSAPAVSRLLAHTELTIGMTLFERVKGRLHATPEARRLFMEIETAYLGIQRVNTVAKELAENRQGSLRVYAHATIGGSFVPRVLSRFHQEYENIGIIFECVRQWELKERLLNSQADVGITLFPMEHPNLDSIRLCNVPISCIVATDHPLAACPETDAQAISQYPIIDYEQGTPFGLVLEELFAVTGYPKLICMRAGTPREVCSLIEAGKVGVGIVDQYSAEEFTTGHRSLKMIPIAKAPLLTARIAHRRYEPMSRPSRSFVSMMQEFVKL